MHRFISLGLCTALLCVAGSPAAVASTQSSARDALLTAMETSLNSRGIHISSNVRFSFDADNYLDITSKTDRLNNRYYSQHTLAPTVNSATWSKDMLELLPRNEVLKGNGSVGVEILANAEPGTVATTNIRITSVQSNLAGSTADATYLIDGFAEALRIYAGRNLTTDDIRTSHDSNTTETEEDESNSVMDTVQDINTLLSARDKFEVIALLSAGNAIAVSSTGNGFTLALNSNPSTIDVNAMLTLADDISIQSKSGAALVRTMKAIRAGTRAQQREAAAQYREWAKKNTFTAEVQMRGNYISSYNITARGESWMVSDTLPEMDLQLSETTSITYEDTFPVISVTGEVINLSKLQRMEHVRNRMQAELDEEANNDPFWRSPTATEMLQQVAPQAWYRSALEDLIKRKVIMGIIDPQGLVYHRKWVYVMYDDNHPLPYPDELENVGPYAALTKLQVLEMTTRQLAERLDREDFVAWAKENGIVNNSFNAETDGAKPSTLGEAYTILYRTIKVYERLEKRGEI